MSSTPLTSRSLTATVFKVATRSARTHVRPKPRRQPDRVVGRDNAPRTTVGKHAATFTPGQWYRVMIEVRNGEVAVQLSNGQSLRGKCNLASTPKRPPQIGFGDGAKGVLVDNIKISAFR